MVNNRYNDVNQAVTYRYLISEDMVADIDDIELEVSTSVGPLGFSSISVQDKVYVMAPTSYFGDYYILAEVDSDDALTEDDETNNLSSTPIMLSHTCLPDVEEPNNDMASATTLFVPPGGATWIPELTSCQGNIDMFTVAVPAGSTYTFRADSMRLFLYGDLDLFLYDDTGSLLARSDGVNTLFEEITWTNNGASAATVYVDLHGFRPNYSNIYEFTLTDVTP